MQTFDHLKQLADGVAAMFGKHCEVVVHDLSNPSRSLIHIAGNITGRHPGAPATDLLLKEIAKDPSAIEDMLNYKTTSADGRTLKSTTIFLRNEADEVFAAFCINLDTTDFFTAAQVLSSFVNTMNSSGGGLVSETFAETSGETIDAVFDQCVAEMTKQPATMTPRERCQLVELLRAQGIFRIKGAVNRVAELSGVSKHTIYNYLKKLKNNDAVNAQGEHHARCNRN